jgi:nucleoside-diphosphate-sugar epimerase
VHILARNGLNWRLSDLSSKIVVHVGDVCSPSLPTILKEISPSVVFHFASYGAMPQEKDIDTMFDVNVKGIVHLITSLPSTVELFVNTGSSSEYGVKDVSMKEDMFLGPLNDYGVSKAAATLYCQRLAKDVSFSIATFRLFSPYGPYEQPTRFIPHVISNMIQKKKLELSSASFVRDFIYVDDVVEAYLKAVIHKDQLEGHIVNIGSGKEYTLGEVVKTVAALLRSSSDISWDEKKKQERQKEPLHWQADIGKAENIVQWKPKYSLQKGLEETITWMKNHLSFYEQ